jgi:queuine tRNA-ribosyltransferase
VSFAFDITYQSPQNRARLGQLHTPHGVVETPAFIFCATKAAIKGATPHQLREEGTQIILSNTYHLMLQPGSEVIRQLGGLQKVTGWNGPMFTDSGGFQIFSLGHGGVAEEIKGKGQGNKSKTMLKITEEGARFKSYVDGSIHNLTPEKSIQVQRDLGADLIVVLDECTPFHVDKNYTQQSMQLSQRWALRSLQEFDRTDNNQQALYGISQGGVYPDLRRDMADFLNNHPFFAFAVGGSLGASKSQMVEVVEMAMENLEPSRPVHLLGIGGISDIFAGVVYGVDTFDCVHPTRLARHGGALVQPHVFEEQEEDPKGREHINLRNARFREDARPIDERCPCTACRTWSRGYIHHLLKANELLAMNIITIHNVNFMNRLLAAVRAGIRDDNLNEVKKEWVAA